MTVFCDGAMDNRELRDKGEKKQERSQLENRRKKVTIRDEKPRQVIKGAVVVMIKTEMREKSLPLVKVN